MQSPRMIRAILSWYVGICAALVVIVQGLSALHQIACWPLLCSLSVVATLALAVARPRLRAPRLPRLRAPQLPFLLRVQPIEPLILPFVLALPAIIAISFAVGWHFPPNNWDALMYHLSRAAYWRQWHTLAHYPTSNWRQNAFPGNAEVLILVTLLLAHSAKLAYLVQFTAYGAASLAVYGLGRQCGLAPTYALIGAGLFATMPEVVLQSDSTQNDLTVAAFVACAVYFSVDAWREGRYASLVLAAMAYGLAIGTKPTSVLALPGLCAAGLALQWSTRHTLRLSWKAGAALLPAILTVLVLGTPWYVANRADYGSFTGPPIVDQTQRITQPTLSTLRINLQRHLVAFVDPSGPALLTSQTTALVCGPTAGLHRWMTVVGDIPSDVPAIEYPGVAYGSAPVCIFDDDYSWFGLAGLLAVITCLAATIAGIARRRLDLPWLLAAGAVSYLLCDSLLLRWQLWESRLMITMLALSAPLLGQIARGLARHLPGRHALAFIVLYATASGLSAATANQTKSLSAWGESPAVMEMWTHPEMGRVFAGVNHSVPANGSLGTLLGVDDWDYPLFGENLNRLVQPLVLSPGGAPRTVVPLRFSYLLTHRPEAEVRLLLLQLYPLRCRMLWSISPVPSPYTWQLYSCHR